MYTLYLNGFFRRMLRNKGYFLINITRLSIALSASMLIFVWILYEKSFDRNNPDASAIYRVYSISEYHYIVMVSQNAMPSKQYLGGALPFAHDIIAV